jgi:hypothetical protein
MSQKTEPKISASAKEREPLDFSVILDGLMAHPESYVNFGEYWWTLKQMLADWIEENELPYNPHLVRGTAPPPDAVELEESEVYRFLEEFHGADDFRDWIAYVNPRPVWNEDEGEETCIEDPEWEESFL